MCKNTNKFWYLVSALCILKILYCSLSLSEICQKHFVDWLVKCVVLGNVLVIEIRGNFGSFGAGKKSYLVSGYIDLNKKKWLPIMFKLR